MKVGVTVPQFQDDPGRVLAAVRAAETAGLDGAFVFDHLWAPGRPDGGVLSALPLLAAMAAVTDRIAVGPLVARIGVVPDAVLHHALATVARIAGPRLVAGIGTGDATGRPENEAFGAGWAPAAERRARLAALCTRLRAAGTTTWIGGGSASHLAVAADAGAAVNLWRATPRAVADAAATVEVTWAGPIDGDAPVVARRLRELASAGASWAVVAFRSDHETLAEAAALLR